MFDERFEIIDAHCHIYPEKIAQKAAASVGSFYDEPPMCGGTVAQMLELGAKAGIDRFVVQSVATAPRQVASINAFIADEVEKANGKLIGFGTLHPDSENQERDLSELVERGLLGVKLHPDIQGFRVDDERCLKIYELCERAGIPILMHTGDKRYDQSNPNRVAPLLERYPNLTLIGAHFGGWSIWEEASEALAKYPNFIVDCSSSLGYLPLEASKRIIRRYGADRVLFGTDYPLHSPVKEMRLLRAMELTEDEYRAILSENVKKLLNL